MNKNPNFTKKSKVLNLYAKNYKTNEVIPASLVRKIKNSGYFNQGSDNVEYLAASLLDMSYHTLEAFKEKGLFDKTTATFYRKNILEKNGTMDAMQMFVNFRGREPVIEPLLKNRGLI